MSIDASIDAADFGALARRLRQTGRSDLNRHMRARIRKAGRLIMDDQKSAVQSLPSGGAEHTGLYASTAAALQLQIRAKGVRIRVNSAKMRPDQQRLPRLMNKGRWRHPVRGNRDVWVTQTVPPGWFDKPAQRRAVVVRREVIAAMTEAAREIEG